jgi:glucose-6-phosphate isomerase
VNRNILVKNSISKNYFNNNSYVNDKKKIIKVVKNIFLNLDRKKNTLHVLSKKFDLNLSYSKLKKFKNLKSVILIGMGGSILGAKAIYSFLEKKINKNFIFLDNLDQLKVRKIEKNIDLNKSLFIIISKSGNTLETLVNTNLLKDFINHKNTIIITEKKKNLLNTFANNKKILHINHKDFIGGRYSVLSEVGMVPAFLMGLKLNLFRKNILNFFKSKEKTFLIDSIIKLGHIYKSKKINSIIFLNYAPELNEFMYWCQQLVAESLGKKGKGLLPLISPAPRDHHSLLQLYLEGPKDKLFYIFSSKLNKKMKTNKNLFGADFSFVENKELSNIKKAQKNAVIQALKNKNIPYREFEIQKLNEETLGELFSYFILETALVGEFIGINAFNQPGVEEVKVLTKKYLS